MCPDGTNKSYNRHDPFKSDVEKAGRINRGDFFFAIILILVSLSVIGLSLGMPRPGGWATSPGLFPILIGIVLLGMGIGLLLSAIRAGQQPVSQGAEGLEKEKVRVQKKRVVLAVASILVYVFILIPTLHFPVSTLLYLLASLWYFWRGKAFKIITISVIATLFFCLAFTRLFHIMLP